MTIETTKPILQTALQDLQPQIKGQLVFDHDEIYDTARKVWNGMIDKKPALIVRCGDKNDVIHAVKFARKHRLLLAVRGGGHSIPGYSTCDGGMVIDLSGMRKVTVDASSYTARAEGGALWSDLDQATQQHGLATTGGTVSHTGIGGLTLGGGQGWLQNSCGLTCDNLIAVEIVTADGKLVNASLNENPDLFWALRGGGGNFGVATSFVYRLHKIGPSILGGMILYPIDQVKKALAFYREFSMQTPDELSMIAALITTPDGSPVIALAPAWFGEMEEGAKILEPLRSFGEPLADLVGVIPYTQLQTMLDAAVPHGMHRYLKMGYLPALPDDAIECIVEHTIHKTSPYSIVLFNCIKGAVTKIAPSETAFVHRNPQWHFEIFSQWTDPGEATQHMLWTREFWKKIQPFTSGVSTNFLDADDHDRIKTAYGQNYNRLSRIKHAYDPDNIFRLNNNIPPAK